MDFSQLSARIMSASDRRKLIAEIISGRHDGLLGEESKDLVEALKELFPQFVNQRSKGTR